MKCHKRPLHESVKIKYLVYRDRVKRHSFSVYGRMECYEYDSVNSVLTNAVLLLNLVHSFFIHII